jgi:hypothetical protein
MFPIMGLLLFFIPLAGFLAGIVFLCFKRLRYIAAFVFIMPFFSSYGAVIGFFSAAVFLERVGTSSVGAGIGGLVGMVVGGGTGAFLSYNAARGILSWVRNTKF